MSAREFIIRSVLPANPITFDADLCIRCLSCVEACHIDVLIPGPGDSTPLAAYPDECWYCGCCVMECPTGAIHLQHPLMNQARWVEKASLLEKRKD